MKKIITLLFSLGAFATSFAQNNHQQNNDDRNYRVESKWDDQYANTGHYKNWRHFDIRNNYSAKMRDYQIEKINREFDMRIEAMQCDRYLGRHAKKAAIRNAENERSRQIQIVNETFNYNNHWNHWNH